MLIKRHLLRGLKHQEPNRVVVHAMGEYISHSGDMLHAADFLKAIGLSVHILVCPNGDIIRCREDNQGAYHAKGHNVNSLGIEFLVEGEHEYGSFLAAIKKPYLTDAQYKAGKNFVRDTWWIKGGVSKLVRHSDISPGRKHDPGEGFPWERFKREVGV